MNHRTYAGKDVAYLAAVKQAAEQLFDRCTVLANTVWAPSDWRYYSHATVLELAKRSIPGPYR